MALSERRAKKFNTRQLARSVL